MSFTTIKFIIFFSIVLLTYYSVPQKFQRFVLLVASYVFYGFTSLKALIIMVAITLITFIGGRVIAYINASEQEYLSKADLEKEAKKAYKKKQTNKRSIVLAIVVVSLLGILGTFKYSRLDILLPVGLSFYIFQSMGYMIDVYRGMVDAEKDITKYALYVSFFPQVLQGPIGDYASLSPQLYEGHDFDRKNVVYGLQRAAWGFFKKLVIANSIALSVDRIFDQYYHYSGVIWILVLGLYSIQLYADFSGYMDIAIGCAQCLGTTLSENFTSPYFATSIADFWRKWHITLGAWFKNYLFYPLLRSKWLNDMRKKYKKKGNTYLSTTLPNVCALIITWFCIGLWHGGDWSYVLYGMFHGFFVIMDSVLSPVYTKWRDKHSKLSDSKGFCIFRVIRTFTIVTIGYAIFRPANLQETAYIYKNMFAGINKSIIGTFLYNNYYYLIAAFIGFIVMFFVDLYHEKNANEVGSLRALIADLGTVKRWVIYCVGISAIVYLGSYGDAALNTFAYFQF